MFIYIKNMVLIMLTCIVIGCVDKPKYHIGDRVSFTVPQDYYLECRGSGTITGIVYTVTGEVTYNISPDPKLFQYRMARCPDLFNFEEHRVRKYERMIREDLFDE